MTVKQVQYENLLATCSDYQGAIALLKQYRPYLEVIPSMRRPKESVVTIPLPVVRVRNPIRSTEPASVHLTVEESRLLPCDVALLMCDPEWKIKTGVEILVFIHRPNEDFSDLLMRWRRTQILLDQGYEWLLPTRHQHLLNDGAEIVRPLFVVFSQSPDRILKGLKGSGLATIVHADDSEENSDEAAISLLAEGELSVEAAEAFDFSDLDDVGQSGSQPE
jgi:hypothetical protein